jgi:predicted TIM-barrel fold metal-dependent hydrolase
MDELHRRRAVVLVHPSHLPGPTVDGIPAFLTDFLLDTTRAAVNLVRVGAMTRWSGIRFILSHAGGFLPYAAHRIAYTRVDDGGISPEDMLEAMRGFYFDTALSNSPTALPSLLAFARPGHVLFGSDWPYAPQRAVRHFSAGWARHPLLTPAQRDEIGAANAERLFDRVIATVEQR